MPPRTTRTAALAAGWIAAAPVRSSAQPAGVEVGGYAGKTVNDGFYVLAGYGRTFGSR